MRVRFTRDALYENEGPNKGHEFKSGEVFDFKPDFANRWIRRDDAVEIEGGKNAVLVGREGPFVPVGAKVDKPPAEKPPVDKPVVEKPAVTKPVTPAPHDTVPGADTGNDTATGADAGTDTGPQNT